VAKGPVRELLNVNAKTAMKQQRSEMMQPSTTAAIRRRLTVQSEEKIPAETALRCLNHRGDGMGCQQDRRPLRRHRFDRRSVRDLGCFDLKNP